MAIEIQSFDELDTTLVLSELDALVARMQESHPEVDLRRGVFHDTLAYYHAQASAALRTNINRYLSARSLADIQADPTLADTGVTDGVLSNWGMTRQPGGQATGEVTMVLSANTGVTLAVGAIFTANGQTFTTTQVYTSRTNPDTIYDDSDRLLSQLSDGTWAFTFYVTAVESGEAGMLTKDTVLTPDVTPADFVRCYATADFADGVAEETNEEMIARLTQGIAAKTISNRANMAAMLRQITAFARIVDMSIIGFGDAEMLRDQHSILPISYGGRIDWYIRSQPSLQRTSLVKTATLIEKTAEGYGIWQFSVTREEAPGFYEFRNIRVNNSEEGVDGFTVAEDLRTLDLTDWSGLVPDMIDTVEGVYSTFQTATIRFEDTSTVTGTLALGATQEYLVEAVGLPLIGEVQQTVSSRDYRSACADVLIKAPVPCFLQLTFTVYKRADEDAPDTDAIKTALMDRVHAVGFVGHLYAAQLQDVIHNHLSSTSSVGNIDMLGRIRRPDGTNVWVRSSEVLTIPDTPQVLTTGNTVQFFLDVADIAVNVVSREALTV